MSSLDERIDEILKRCVDDCADCIMMYDTDEYAGKEAFKYRNQLAALVASERQAAVEAERAWFAEKLTIYNDPSTPSTTITSVAREINNRLALQPDSEVSE